MNSALVSVIIPMYNREDYIEKCIESIQAQTYQNLEIIVIDDNSTDSSYNKVKKIAEKDFRIKLYKNINKGVSNARNLGIEKSTGRFIQFVDSDDYIKENMIIELLQNIEKFKTDIAYCKFNITEKKINNFHVSVNNFFEKYFYFFMENCLFQGPCNKLYVSKIIKNNNIYFPINIEKLEDSVFNAKYFKFVKNVSYIDKGLYIYENTNNSLSKKIEKNEIISIINFYNILLKQNCINSITKYAIKQIEILYRNTYNIHDYKKYWNYYYSQLIEKNFMLELQKNYNMFNFRYKIFFHMISYQKNKALKVYFEILNSLRRIKKILRKWR